MELLLSILNAPIVCVVVGAYAGFFLSQRSQEKDINNVRAIATDALKMFKSYAKKSFKKVENEFNNKFNASEKRAILVSLAKIGIPFELPTKNSFDINNVCFEDVEIDEKEISGMILQIKKGNCDSFFFNDVESYFFFNIQNRTIREVAKKYVEKVLAESYLKDKSIVTPSDWEELFSLGEKRVISVFIEQVEDINYFLPNGTADRSKIKTLMEEISVGMWDNYIFWNYEWYQNVRMSNMIVAKQIEEIKSTNGGKPKTEKEES